MSKLQQEQVWSHGDRLLSPHPPWYHLKCLPTLGPVSLPRVLSHRNPFHRQVQRSLEATACECHLDRSVPQRSHTLVPESGKTKILALAQHRPGPSQHHGLIAGKTSSGSSRRNVTGVQMGLTGEEGQKEVCPGC